MSDIFHSDATTPEPNPAAKGFPFPLPILLVTKGSHEYRIDEGLEGTLVEPVDAFNDMAIFGRRFETVIIDTAGILGGYDAPLAKQVRAKLVDWINLLVMPRLRVGRLPIWL